MTQSSRFLLLCTVDHMISVQTAANRILASLPQAERGLILSLCDEVGLRLGDTIDEVGEPVRYLYFPLDAAISVMGMRNEHHTTRSLTYTDTF